MKKILLATTMLVASVTFANAQAVTISGEGRMGVRANHGPFSGNWTIGQESRLQLNFNVAVQADHGLTFGAWTRARMQSTFPGDALPGVFSPARVWVESNGFRLTFGNVDGAISSVAYGPGCRIGYEGGQICADTAGLDSFFASGVQYATSTGSVYPSHALATFEGDNFAVAVSHQRGGSTEVAANYSFGAFSVAGGYSNFGDDGIYSLSGTYDAGAWAASLLLARLSNEWFINPHTNFTISASTSIYGGSLYGFVGRDFSHATYGVSYGYDLGGGATLTAGAEHWDFREGLTTASVGVAFTF